MFDDEVEERGTTVHGRYHVNCGTCGFLESAMRKHEALGIAAHAAYPRIPCSVTPCPITIFDSMAHEGAPDVFDYRGIVLQRKGREETADGLPRAD